MNRHPLATRFYRTAPTDWKEFIRLSIAEAEAEDAGEREQLRTMKQEAMQKLYSTEAA